MDLDQYRHDSLDAWDRFASNWDAERAYLWEKMGHLSERLVERLDPGAGDTVLELAAGTGETGLLLSERVGEQGRVLCTDFAPEMVEIARRRGAEQSRANIDFRVLDAERMELEDSSVDGVLARFGYMLMADPAAALAETRRVLRDGGRVSFAVWAGPDKNMWAALPGMVLVERGHLPPPEPGAPGIFAMADPDRIRELVTGAGFGEPRIEQVSVEWGYLDADEHWKKTNSLAAPIAEAVSGLDPGERETVRRTVAERLEELLAADASGADGLTHLVVAE